MNYRHVYMLIIEHAKSETLKGLRPKTRKQKYTESFKAKYFEMHHILPKSLFPNWNKCNSNLVALTAREHFFCHQLLTKIYPNSGMILALFLLCNDKKHTCIKSSKQYEIIRSQFADFLSKMNKGLYGSFSEEKKQLIQEKRLDALRKNGTEPIGEKNGMYGKHWCGHLEWKRCDRSGENNPNYGNHILAGENNPMYGKNIKDFMSLEAYQKWLDIHKGRTMSEESKRKRQESFRKTMKEKGRIESEETKKEHFRKMVETRRKNGSYKMSRNQKLKISKQVKCVEDGTIFDSMNECGKYYNITNVCRIINHHKGYAKAIDKHFILI